jgi:uncharacterized membrane protein
VAIGLAIATGFVIASYSAVDLVGVRLVEPWLYTGLLWASMTLMLLGLLGTAARSPGLARLILDPAASRPNVRRAAAGGLVTLVSYGLVLLAFRLAPLTAVAPLRESAVVLASGWGAIRLRETTGRRAAAGRIGAAGLIVAGAVLLAIDG